MVGNAWAVPHTWFAGRYLGVTNPDDPKCIAVEQCRPWTHTACIGSWGGDHYSGRRLARYALWQQTNERRQRIIVLPFCATTADRGQCLYARPCAFLLWRQCGNYGRVHECTRR